MFAPSSSLASVGTMQVMVTNNAGSHSARHWAWATTRGIFEAQPTASPSRIAQLARLQRAMVEALEPFFSAPRPNDAPLALDTILSLTETTEWAANFTHPDIASSIQQLLRRNLATAAAHQGSR